MRSPNGALSLGLAPNSERRSPPRAGAFIRFASQLIVALGLLGLGACTADNESPGDPGSEAEADVGADSEPDSEPDTGTGEEESPALGHVEVLGECPRPTALPEGSTCTQLRVSCDGPSPELVSLQVCPRAAGTEAQATVVLGMGGLGNGPIRSRRDRG